MPGMKKMTFSNKKKKSVTPYGRYGSKYKPKTIKRSKGARSGGSFGNVGVMGNALMRPTIAYHADALPRIMVTKFKYSYAFTLSTNALQTVAAGAFDTFRLNSPQDPYFGLGGSSAQGWGIAQTYYGNYIVTGATARVTFSDPSADGLWCGVRFRQNSDNTPNGESLIQLKNTQQTAVRAINNTGSQVQVFRTFVRPWVLTSKDRQSYMYDMNNSAQTTTVPANDNVIFDVFALNQNASAQTLQCIVEIEYITKLYNRVAI